MSPWNIPRRACHGAFAALAIGLLNVPAGSGAEAVDPTRFEREVLVAVADDPVSLSIDREGRVFFVERAGGFKMWDPATRTTSLLAVLPTHAAWDTGLLSLLLARDFEAGGHFYVLRCPEDKHRVMRVSRFTLKDGRVDLAAEKAVLEWTIDTEDPPHCGGDLAWDREGNLVIGTGENTPPQDVPAFDPSPGKELFDARRSSANSRDLRGKILRITPRPDGTYSIPPGNLFPDGKDGRPEVFAMGIRNAFRVSVDTATGWILWGDVGGNVDASLGLGPEGYDEINLAKDPGFYGWPFMSGPNAPWRPFDPATKKPSGAPFDPAHVVNDSSGNTGLRELPPARPALLWYPTAPSAEWPGFGSGGRSITGGPVFRSDPASKSGTRLPDAYDGCLIFGEWMRNWIKIARLTPDGRLVGIEPFMPGTTFRKPTDLKIGPDGALYVVEYGDRFRENRDGQIVRCVYRRGNRAPVARASADVAAGALPLTVNLSAVASTDPDGDPLTYSWRFPGGATAIGATASITLTNAGRWMISAEVSDPSGAKSLARVPVVAGNTPPRLRFTEPADGGFFTWDKPVRWRVVGEDAEDGPLAPAQFRVQVERRDRLNEADAANTHPGLALMRAGACFGCHASADKSAGPAYLLVARRHAGTPGAREMLAAKILKGGSGVWGPAPMPPNPNYTPAQARQMADWVLGLAARQASPQPAGDAGELDPRSFLAKGEPYAQATLVLTAGAADKARGAAPALLGEAAVALRSRRQRAAHYDAAAGASFQQNLGDDLVARLEPGGWIRFDRIDLAAVGEIAVTGRRGADAAVTLEARLDSPDGERWWSAELAAGPDGGRPAEIRAAVVPRTGLHPVHFVAKTSDAELLFIEFR